MSTVFLFLFCFFGAFCVFSGGGGRHALQISLNHEKKTVLRSRNYLFSAPASGSFSAPPLSIISAPAPAPAIYCHLKLYYNSSTIRNKSQWKFFFILAYSKLTAVNIYSVPSKLYQPGLTLMKLRDVRLSCNFSATLVSVSI